MNEDHTYLFVPGNKESVIQKALLSNADVVIIDLEDAVPENQKMQARQTVIRVLSTFENLNRAILIRINGTETSHWANDLEVALKMSVSGIMLPKAESKSQIQMVVEKVNSFGTSNFVIIPLIETAKGLLASFDIATAHPLVERLAFGSVDFSLDIDAEPSKSGHELLYARSKLIIISRAANILSPIDSPYIEIHNEQGFNEEVRNSKHLGFKAKLLIHPNQINLLNTLYKPSKEKLDEAIKVVEIFEQSIHEGQTAAISYNGMMIDYPVYKRAKFIVDKYLNGSKSITFR